MTSSSTSILWKMFRVKRKANLDFVVEPLGSQFRQFSFEFVDAPIGRGGGGGGSSGGDGRLASGGRQG